MTGCTVGRVGRVSVPGIACLLFSAAALAQADPAPDIAEPGASEEIAEATTESRFLSPWVAYLPASATVPSPRVFLHRIAGAGPCADCDGIWRDIRCRPLRQRRQGRLMARNRKS